MLQIKRLRLAKTKIEHKKQRFERLYYINGGVLLSKPSKISRENNSQPFAVDTKALANQAFS